MLDQLFNLPLVVVGSVIIGVLCLFAAAGLFFTRRRILPRLRIGGDDSNYTGTMVQAIMVFYGLAIALVAVSVWETHSSVSDCVSLEAGRLGGLYRDTGGYPEPLKSELRGHLKGYADYVIQEAWPAQRRGEVPLGGVAWMDRFQAGIDSFEPATEGQKIRHAEALRAYNLLIEARRLRLDAALSRLSGMLWVMIVAGALISLISTFFFTVTDARLHLTLVLLLAGFMGLVITMVFAFDRPFQGDLAVDAEPFVLIKEQLMTP